MSALKDIKSAIESNSALSAQFRQAVEKFIDNIKTQAPIVRQRQADEYARNKAEGRVSHSHMVITDDLFRTDEQKEHFLLAIIHHEATQKGVALSEALQVIHDRVQNGYGEINYHAG
ncbi:MAG: hypothetical protein LRZ85_03190 [Alphaproteobacteria bacterium]|nr:hypothetical protein [Alphaproteobacteria bacterium]MCD8526039.1 hypothetical protein [Alphaproteobacteria bacterium]MCD8570605.1 hypothetical protein [Alphaproteobacteria bacterium]